jgi:adenosylcobinamide kinase/adenosylcobinamide-phosphate guanylyltransferase
METASEIKAFKLSTDEKPYYVATYDNSFGDDSMQQRIDNHIIERNDDFEEI